MCAANETTGTLDTGAAKHLACWRVKTHPLIFSLNPAAFDEQIACTLRNYRDQDWTALKLRNAPQTTTPCVEPRPASKTRPARNPRRRPLRSSHATVRGIARATYL
jgi:hypothetical protein